MSLLTALLTGLGGYGQGRQQRTQNQQTQEQIDQQNQYLQLAQQKQQREMAPLQPLPQNLTQIRPNNQGKGGAATDQQLIDHLYAVANFYAGQPGAEAQNMSNAALSRASALESILKQNQSLNVRTMLDYYNQGQQNQRTQDTIGGALQRNQNTIGGADERNQATINALLARTLLNNQQSNVNNQRTTSTSRANTAANIEQRNQTQTDLFMRGYEGANAKAKDAAAKAGTDPVLPYPNLDSFKQNLAKNIATVSEHPDQLKSLLTTLDAHAKDYDPEWIKYAKQSLQEAARLATQAQQTGGSQDNSNPTSPWP